ncbi:MAG: UDP-N-acetylmuramate--L-alanine ligase [Alphaproteobacteria bacterium ADurb.Bin438]|nr:MAG: UDP-N-acetylmuramate--L-alanine ligase [Alphaproteobacteria bacterium ADurb.Bin438]
MNELLPFKMRHIHFIAIGGIGMSGIAELMHNLGYTIQGSDIVENANVKRLKQFGIKTFIGHDAANVENAQVVVYSSAIKEDNPELLKAKELRIPIVHRAEMLAELMRLKWSIAIGGTHGKTTTTSMVATLLDEAKLDPTVINGGIIKAYGSNTKKGEGAWLVAEADESDCSFLKFPSTITVVTNIDEDHMEHYNSIQDIEDAFYHFAMNTPFYGFSVMCTDDEKVQSLVSKITTRKIITYGFNRQAEVRAVNIRKMDGYVLYDAEIASKDLKINDIRLNVFGDHNILNSLVMVSIGVYLDIDGEIIKSAINKFESVQRRYTKTGEIDNITIIDDYAHHPSEIKAVLKATRDSNENANIIAVFQPHRYTRVKALLDRFSTCFNDADTVIVSDIYAASEKPIEGIDRIAIVDSIKAHGHRKVLHLSDPNILHEVIRKEIKDKNQEYKIICMGAGTITSWAQNLPSKLKEIM